MGKFTALGANIFAGLFTVGVKAAGFDILGHLEHGPYGVASCRLNFPKLDIRVGRENWNEKEFKNKVDFMYTNPPCAAWSAAGSGNWQDQLPRLRYIYDCVEAGIAIRPKAWAWESVTGAWGQGRQYVLQQAEAWNDAGYHVTILLQDNQFLGAPQERRRMFFIAHLHPLVWPKLTKTITAAEAFKTLPKKLPPVDLKDPRFLELHKYLWKKSYNYGGYLRRTFEEEGRGPKKLEGGIPSVLARRLYPDRAAPVMIGADKRFHPTEMRYVNWHEWLVLCGLPLDWKTTEKSFGAASQELGRAVLPPVGRWLATAVKNGLDQPKIKGRVTTRLVDFRDPEATIEQTIFVYDGPTIKPIIPPPLPRLDAPRAPAAPRTVTIDGKTKTLPSVAHKQRSHSKPGSGARIRELLVKGWDPEKILVTIHKEFPESKATKSDVAWNKGRLRRDGVNVP